MGVFDDMQGYLLARMAPCPITGCWVWQRQKDKNGYGHFRQRKGSKWQLAHRESFAAFKCEPKANVLHTCDNPACINPDHLYDGTQKENVRDAIERGRFRTAPHTRKEKCRAGHDLTPENRLGTRAQDCKICHRIRQAKYREAALAI